MGINSGTLLSGVAGVIDPVKNILIICSIEIIIRLDKLELSKEGISMKAFICSLCHNGILGGGLYLDTQSLTYKTNKLTVDKKYKNLVLPMQEIGKISWKWIVFPIATVHMKTGEVYQFIIFNKSRFEKWFEEYSRINTK